MFFLNIDIFTPFCVNLCRLLKWSWFLGVIKPLEDTSKHVTVHFEFALEQSVTKWAYLSHLSWCLRSMLVSRGHVSSNKCTSLLDLSIITMSGFSTVIQISASSRVAGQVTVHCVLLLVNTAHYVVHNIIMARSPAPGVFSYGTNIQDMVCCLSSSTQGAHVWDGFLPSFKVCLAREGVYARIQDEL
jgi:hypothetical protein